VQVELAATEDEWKDLKQQGTRALEHARSLHAALLSWPGVTDVGDQYPATLDKASNASLNSLDSFIQATSIPQCPRIKMDTSTGERIQQVASHREKQWQKGKLCKQTSQQQPLLQQGSRRALPGPRRANAQTTGCPGTLCKAQTACTRSSSDTDSFEHSYVMSQHNERPVSGHQSSGDAVTSLKQLDEHLSRLEDLLVLNREMQVIKAGVAKAGDDWTVHNLKARDSKSSDGCTSLVSGETLDLTCNKPVPSMKNCFKGTQEARSIDLAIVGARVVEKTGSACSPVLFPVPLADPSPPAEVDESLSNLSATLHQRLPQLRKCMDDLDRCVAIACHHHSPICIRTRLLVYPAVCS
jgi:hypothetical protein